MSWTDPGAPPWAAFVLVLLGINLFGLIISVLIERFGLPRGWSLQDTPRKPGMLRRHLPLILANLTVLISGAGLGFKLFGDFFPFVQPSLWETVFVFGGLVLFDDLGFYWVHRLLHTNKDWYRRFHKQHHRAYAPVPIEYIHAHPVEWMSGTTLPVGYIIGMILFTGSMNAWLLLAWVAFRQLHELDIHSGTPSVLGRFIPFYGTVRQHDLHHAKPHAGNYASTLDIWDRVFGTRIPETTPGAMTHAK
jgi:sterol desaturase/sphingolipid hydroxylase (fatty acid hydroxylase superfamily)